MANSRPKRPNPKSSKTSGKIANKKQWTIRRIDPKSLLEQMGMSEETAKVVSEFQQLKGQAKVEASRKVIQDSIIDIVVKPDARFVLALRESESLLKGYATLDDQHRSDIGRLMKDMTAYLRDTGRKRPFNALMLAAPGAGKSTFIKQLAAAMKRDNVQAVNFNMATMHSHDDIAQPIDQLRNLKVNDQFPLLFLDEFDSDPSRYPSLLPLLWDGELQIGHRELKLGKAIIVLAGSNPDLPKVMEQSAKMRLEANNGEAATAGKLIDLLSRINGGVIRIPDLDLRSEHRDRRVDKVCVAIELMKARFDRDLTEIPRCLLRFIAYTSFRYGVRSIAHLIDQIETDAYRNGSLKGEALGLAFTSEESLQNSSLKLHLLDENQGFGIVNRWKEFSKDKLVVKLSDPALSWFPWRAKLFA